MNITLGHQSHKSLQACWNRSLTAEAADFSEYDFIWSPREGERENSFCLFVFPWYRIKLRSVSVLGDAVVQRLRLGSAGPA